MSNIHPSQWPRSAARLVLDIETVPTAEALAAPYPAELRNPPGNYKSAETISKWREQDEQDWRAGRVKECSLNPRLGRIICVGAALTAPKDADTVFVLTAWDAHTERDMLRLVWEHIAMTQGHVATWNGAFDLRWLWLRSVHLGLQLPRDAGLWVRDWFRRYSLNRHFDCKAALTQWDTPVRGEGLSEWATFLGVTGKPDGMDGSKVWEMYQDHQYGTIKQYCHADVVATREVYYRIAPLIDPHGEYLADDDTVDGAMRVELAEQKMGLF